MNSKDVDQFVEEMTGMTTHELFVARAIIWKARENPSEFDIIAFPKVTYASCFSRSPFGYEVGYENDYVRIDTVGLRTVLGRGPTAESSAYERKVSEVAYKAVRGYNLAMQNEAISMRAIKENEALTKQLAAAKTELEDAKKELKSAREERDGLFRSLLDFLIFTCRKA